VIERLLGLAERATSRSTVFQALNALVETGVISELGALSRMDEWKDKHR
jgi:Fe2+ or Zn2+ uptake regulation protein